MSVFSSKPSMQMRCYRVEYGSCGSIKKAVYYCILVVTLANIFLRILVKAERMSKRLKFIAYHGNNLIIHKFLVCQEVF
jgi:hypothetical protein